MKSESFILINDNIRNKAIQRVLEIICDGKTKLTISDAGSKTARQNALDWMWNTEIANSGYGGEYEDTKEGVHLISKYRWVVPILIRDDDFFSDLWGAYVNKYGSDPERMKWFVDTQVHTMNLTKSQTAEYLTEKQRYYSGKGVNLTNPDDMGLLEM